MALFALVLRVPAGTWRWPAARVFLSLYLAFAVPAAIWLFTNPCLLAGLDFRLGWSDLPPAARAVAFVLVGAF